LVAPQGEDGEEHVEVRDEGSMMLLPVLKFMCWEFGRLFRGIFYIEECLGDLKDVITPVMCLRPFLGRFYEPCFLKTGQDIHMGFIQELWTDTPGPCCL
jgi:hypothetical protein